MNSPSVDIAGYIADNGIATLGNDLFIGRVPDSPDQVVVVSTTTAREPETCTSASPGHLRIDRPNVQVYVRAKKNQNAIGYSLIESIKELLHGVQNLVISDSEGDTRYHSIYVMSDIGELGVDEKLRPVFSVNFRMERSSS